MVGKLTRGCLLGFALVALALVPQSGAEYQTEYPLGSFMPGVPANSSLIRFGIPRPITMPAGLPTAVCIAKEAATSTTVVTLNHVVAGVGTSIGTLTWSASGTSCAVTFSSSVNFAANDILEEAFPATADATLGDIAITLPAVRR